MWTCIPYIEKIIKKARLTFVKNQQILVVSESYDYKTIKMRFSYKLSTLDICWVLVTPLNMIINRYLLDKQQCKMTEFLKKLRNSFCFIDNGPDRIKTPRIGQSDKYKYKCVNIHYMYIEYMYVCCMQRVFLGRGQSKMLIFCNYSSHGAFY